MSIFHMKKLSTKLFHTATVKLMHLLYACKIMKHYKLWEGTLGLDQENEIATGNLTKHRTLADMEIFKEIV